MGRAFRWVALGAGSVLTMALLAATAPFALQRAPESWDAEAGSAARRRLLDLVPEGAGVEFADVKVRHSGTDNERSVCGAFAVWGGEGSLGPFRDFWIVVTKRPDAPDAVEAAHPVDIPQDAFLDRGSEYYRHCFARLD